AGHWERERAGKRWNPSRWEQRDGRWARVEGGWVDAAAPMPPPPPPPGHQRPPRQWKLELPVVSSYWPAKGKPGSRVTIRGKNFPATAEVVFAGQPVKAAKIKDDQIVFVVPQGAASGDIALRAGGRRALPVGMFEVAAGFDPVAEQRRLEQERQKAAEAAWKARQQQLAKDRAAREQWLREREQERQATRDQRRAERIAALNAKWARAFLADPDTQSELTLHAQRVAELERAKEVAEVANNGKLVIRIGVAQSREDERHQQRMAALQASFNANGGQP
ncbi:MAG TPA: IPT/TIG domain-containing protein, partial [Kofleriaceae bacterium]|nr:IPT/TIG domain-containing protein [Kofleriaceae bacterium]